MNINSNDEIINLLGQILNNQQLILQELTNLKIGTQKLDSHINFVENVYNIVRKPLNYITGIKLHKKTNTAVTFTQYCNQTDKIHNESMDLVHLQQ